MTDIDLVELREHPRDFNPFPHTLGGFNKMLEDGGCRLCYCPKSGCQSLSNRKEECCQDDNCPCHDADLYWQDA